MIKIYPALKNLVPLFFLLFSITAFSQISGDFRSKATGSWTTPGSWETYNGTIWVNATTYPGQNIGTYTVSIQTGHTISILTNLVTASMGNVIVNGTLNLVAGSDPKKIILSTLLLRISGGSLSFDTQKTELYLPENSVIQIDNGGTIAGAASNNTEIYIGTSLVAVGAGGGGGGILTFGNVVTSGGTLNSEILTPSNNTTISCQGQVINLLGKYSGSSAAVNYTWTVKDPDNVIISLSNATGPLANNTVNTTPTSFSTTKTGNYLISLSVTTGANGYTNVETKTIIVSPIPTAPIISLTQPTCAVATGTITVTAPTGTGMTYSINGSTYTNTTGIFTAVAAATYSVTAKSAAGCVSPPTSVTINSQPATPAKPTASATLQPTCAVATGTITVTAPTGTGMTYSINGSTYTNTTGIFTAVAAATYSVTAKSDAGCVSLPTSVTINSQPSINTWNGSADINWNNAANWCTGVPSITNNLDVVIPSASTTTYSPTLSTGAFGYVENILFESGSIVTVEDNYLFVKKNLTLNGKIDLNNEAQLVQDTGSSFDTASTGNIEIDQQGTSDNFKYNYWGSPVNKTGTAYTIAGVLRDGTYTTGTYSTTINELNLINFGAPYAYADVAETSPIRLSTYWMYKYANLGNGYSGWTRAGKDGILQAGEGFTMKGSNTNLPEQNYTFLGKPNNGDINLTISANNDYLIGNPYPSALDAKQFIRDNINQVVVNNPTDPTETGNGNRTVNIIDGNLYFWDHFGGGNHLLKSYEGGYAIFNLSGSVLAVSNDALTKNTGATSNSGKVPQRFIPVAQGFFVTSLDGGQIQFKNSQRLFKKENASVSQFMKSAKISKASKEIDEDTFPRIHLNYSSPKGYQRQLLVAFIENTTDGIDIGYDAMNNETFPEDMSWRTNNINFIIQAVSSLNDERILPLEVKVATLGIIKISIDDAENIPEDTEIFMKDNTTGEMHNISQKPFEIELTAGKYTDRFALTFKTQKLVAEDVKAEIVIPAASQPIIEGIHVFMNNAIGELQIKNNSIEEIVSVALINSLGQTIKSWNSNFNIRTISLPINIATGVYLVQINSKMGKVVKKVIID